MTTKCETGYIKCSKEKPCSRHAAWWKQQTGKYSAQLETWFRKYNRQFFEGRLKDILVCWDSCNDIPGLMGAYHPIKKRIRINEELVLWEMVARIYLLHEMAHANLHMKKVRGFRSHGKTFNQEMLRLAKAGALNGLW